MKICKMLSCHCLNVIIEIEGDLQKVTSDTLELSQDEIQDIFFKQDIEQVGKLINISKTHSGLIQTRNVGSWAIHCCINCDVHSHAVHREKGASCVLVNSKLLKKNAINKLQTSDNFSKLYKIIINSDIVIEDELIANSYLPNDVENVIKGLKQVAADALKKEAISVEERIRQFTDEQYSKLNDLRDRAFREQQILTKIILNNTLEDKKITSTNLSMSNPQGMPSRLNEPLAAGSIRLPTSPSASTNSNRHTPKRQKSCPVNQINSFDTEGLFEFEGNEDVQSGTGSELDESDLDDAIREDGVKIPKRGSTGGNAIAKSLPMTIPTFLSQARNRDGFEDIDDAPPIEHNMDIAASIKALAKSVHGDPVFGDLPKPRYTYI